MDAEQRNLLLVISGPSGSGKNTLIDHIMANRKEASHSVSATTRKPRGAEQNGKEYYFLSPEEFEETVRNGGFFEYDEYRGNRYGTLKSDVKKKLGSGKNVVLDLTIPGAINVKKEFGGNAKTVFIVPPSIAVLRERLYGRGSDSKDTIEKRIQFALDMELDQFGKFDYVIINDDLEASKRAILAIYDSLTKGVSKEIAKPYKIKNAAKKAAEIIECLKNEKEIVKNG